MRKILPFLGAFLVASAVIFATSYAPRAVSSPYRVSKDGLRYADREKPTDIMPTAQAAVDGNDFQTSRPVAAIYKLSPSTLADGDQDVLHTDSAHRVLVSIGANTAGTTNQQVVGAAASGAAKSGNPVLMAGQDGTNAVTFKTDSSGNLQIQGAAAAAAAVAGNPLLMGASDGTNAQTLICDPNGLFQFGPPVKSAWSATNAAAVNGTPSASKTAGAAGVKHVCTGISIALWQDGTGTASPAGGTVINLRDGASGAGSVVASWTVSYTLTAFGNIPTVNLSGMNFVGTAATAMTLEASAALPLHTGGTCTLWGYDTK